MKPNYLDAVVALFQSMPGEPITCWTLAEVGGKDGWRTRVSEARRWRRMNIPAPKHHRLENGVRYTTYVYLPPVPRTVQPDLFEQVSL